MAIKDAAAILYYEDFVGYILQDKERSVTHLQQEVWRLISESLNGLKTF